MPPRALPLVAAGSMKLLVGAATSLAFACGAAPRALSAVARPPATLISPQVVARRTRTAARSFEMSDEEAAAFLLEKVWPGPGPGPGV